MLQSLENLRSSNTPPDGQTACMAGCNGYKPLQSSNNLDVADLNKPSFTRAL